MFSAKSVRVPQGEETVPGIVCKLFSLPPITINFLGFTFTVREIKYFANINYSCPVGGGAKYARAELTRDKFVLLNEGSNITVKIIVYRDYAYGIPSPIFSIPVGIEIE